jgi:hypothetical protein
MRTTSKGKRVWPLRDVTNEPDNFFPVLNYRGETGDMVSRIVQFNEVHFLYSDRPGGPRTWGGWSHWKTADLLYRRVTPTGTDDCWFQVHPGLPVYFIDYCKPLLTLGWFTQPDTNVPHVACYVPQNSQDTLLTSAQRSHLGNILRFVSIWCIDLLRTYTYAKAWDYKRPALFDGVADMSVLLEQLEAAITDKPDALPAGVKSGLKDLNLMYSPSLNAESSVQMNATSSRQEDVTAPKRPRIQTTQEVAQSSKSGPNKRQNQGQQKVSTLIIRIT